MKRSEAGIGLVRQFSLIDRSGRSQCPAGHDGTVASRQDAMLCVVLARYSTTRPMPNWLPTRTGLAALQVHFDHFFALHGRCPSSSVSWATISRVAVSMTSPVEGQACRPSRLKVIQPGSSRSSMLAICLGGLTRVVEDVHAPVVGVGDPDFLFIRRQAHAVAGAAVPFDRPLVEALQLRRDAASRRIAGRRPRSPAVR